MKGNGKRSRNSRNKSVSAQSSHVAETKKSKPGKNILLNCHSMGHGVEKIYREMKIERGIDMLHFNELNVPVAGDYRIDLSIKQPNVNKMFDRKKFDIIYLVNCPDDVYIDIYEEDRGDFSLTLFNNLSNILKTDGIVMTRISETGINSILQEYNSTHNTSYYFHGFNEDDEIPEEKLNAINLAIKEEFLSLIIPIIRKMMKRFLKTNDLPYKLLRITENKKYIHEDFSSRSDDAIEEFLVMKMIDTGVTSVTGVTASVDKSSSMSL